MISRVVGRHRGKVNGGGLASTHAATSLPTRPISTKQIDVHLVYNALSDVLGTKPRSSPTIALCLNTRAVPAGKDGQRVGPQELGSHR